jgi:hypothetical protein
MKRLSYIFSWINPFWIFIYFYKYLSLANVIKNAFTEEITLDVLNELKRVHGIELRIDSYFGNIYTVVNLEPEIFMNEAAAELFVLEKIREINEALTKLMLADLVTCEMYREKNTEQGAYYYLIVIPPNIVDITIWIILYEIIKIILIIYGICLLF